mmetsp:Transcript_5478/g.4932  ORF Transcript_5478/g.4932 Transcript_5478/m.4932 type:complete len:305 (-) Transcript_5478:79-993(-)
MKVVSVCLASIALSIMKQIKQILPKQSQHWVGDGFLVRPVFADKAFTNDISPFLMFDYGAPRKVEANPLKSEGVGAHPHRGFETVTIIFQGEAEHADSGGGTGTIGAGDVQWMTAGSGVIHQEFLSKNFMKQGGVIEAAQLWVNLPAKNKWVKPRYQAILKQNIPVIPLDNDSGNVRVIAGKFHEATGPAETFTPLNVLDITLNKGKRVAFEIENGYNTILFVRRGEIITGSNNQKLGLEQVAIMTTDGSNIEIEATTENTAILLLSGLPLNEPIAHGGPFVMNTRSELNEAFSDFQSGKLVRN